MRILGIDPGLATVGYAVIEKRGNIYCAVEYGCIKTPANWALPVRLKEINQRLNELFDRLQPQAMAVELLYFNRNVNNALLVAQARGVCLLAASQRECPVAEYTPLQVKQAVVGNGRAAKQQVGAMVKMLLKLPVIPAPDDVADALAVALCHSHNLNFNLREV
jgi:crossover junction endodeoxyribonuclease RuvC